MSDQTTLAALREQIAALPYWDKRSVPGGFHVNRAAVLALVDEAIAAGVRVGDAHPGHCITCDGHLDDPYHGPEPCMLCPHAFPHHEFKRVSVGDTGLDEPMKPHQPGDPHVYEARCLICGQIGVVRITLEPQRAALAGEAYITPKTSPQYISEGGPGTAANAGEPSDD